MWWSNLQIVVLLGLLKSQGFVEGFIFKWKERPACVNGHDHLPDSDDCRTFYHCWGFRLMPKSCGPFLMFNPVTRVCDWPPIVMAVRPECNPFMRNLVKSKSATSLYKSKSRPKRPIFNKPIKRTTTTTTTTTTTAVPKLLFTRIRTSTNDLVSSISEKKKKEHRESNKNRNNDVIFIKPILDLFSGKNQSDKRKKIEEEKKQKLSNSSRENGDSSSNEASRENTQRKRKAILGLNGLFNLSSLKVFTKNKFSQLSKSIP